MLSLVDTILFKDDNAVAFAISQTELLDIIDDYGYTPLIEAVIVESESKLQQLLEAGADANFPDLTGRTALHWAVDYGNIAMIKLLIKHKANTNAYTSAGQPVLVIPWLQGQQEIIRLLRNHGANLQFCQDFIHTKIVGHQFSLRGHIDIISPENILVEMDYEGFYIDSTLPLIQNSLRQYMKNFAGRKVQRYQQEITNIINAMSNATLLLRYQDFHLDRTPYLKTIRYIFAQPLLILPVASEGHCIIIIRFGSWLMRCDRGEYGKKHGTAIIYRIINDQWHDSQFLERLIYQKIRRVELDSLFSKQINSVKKFTTLALSPQQSGNCTWANISGAVPCALLLMHINQMSQQSHTLEHWKDSAIIFFMEWQQWEKDRTISYITNILKKNNHDLRQRCYATILAAIFVQQCHYNKTEDLNYVTRILPILTQKKFFYIIKCYLRILKETDNKILVNKIHEYCDDLGIPLED